MGDEDIGVRGLSKPYLQELHSREIRSWRLKLLRSNEDGPLTLMVK